MLNIYKQLQTCKLYNPSSILTTPIILGIGSLELYINTTNSREDEFTFNISSEFGDRNQVEFEIRASKGHLP